MTLTTAIRRASGRPGPTRGFRPVDQVLRAPGRPLVHHVHHHHLTSTTLQLHVTVPVQVVSTTHPLRVHLAPRSAPAAPVRPPTAFPGLVLRAQALPSVAPATAARPVSPVDAPVHRQDPRAAADVVAPGVRAPRPGPTRVELVHRQPVPSPGSTPREGPALVRSSAASQRPGWGPAAAATPHEPGAAPLTDADVPRVVDHVVRELDRRVVASRERRGWTS